MAHQTPRSIIGSVLALLGLIYLYLLDIPGSLLVRFHQSGKFGEFILLNAIHAIIMCAMAAFIGREYQSEPQRSVRLAGWLMFVNGALFNVAYSMGPPPYGAALFSLQFEEKIRFTFLVAAATLATAGMVIFLFRRMIFLRALSHILAVLVILLGYGLFLWTEISYYVIRPRLLHELVSRGLPLDNKLGQVGVEFEALGRLCFYWGIPIVLAIGIREKLVSRLAATVIGLLSAIAGFGIFGAAMHRPPTSLMPFTIPAFVLMPTYWLGVYLLTNRRSANMPLAAAPAE